MILTDREIEIALDNGQIIIDPRPTAKSYSSTTVDLRLSNVFAVWKPMNGTKVYPGAADYSYDDLECLKETFTQESYELKPQHFVLGWTVEDVSLPIKSRIAARVEGKSSLARLGVGIHVTAPTIHSGFNGNIQLEIFNSGPHDIVLSAGMRVCQLIFEQTYGTPNKGYSGMFAGQKAT